MKFKRDYYSQAGRSRALAQEGGYLQGSELTSLLVDKLSDWLTPAEDERFVPAVGSFCSFSIAMKNGCDIVILQLED